jgi:tetratricopeptide (TPR) repeat protein
MLRLILQSKAPTDQPYLALASPTGQIIAQTPLATPVNFRLSTRDQEDLRWYLEDYMQYPQEPAPKIATRIERRMVDIGEALFAHIFQASEGTRQFWETICSQSHNMRVEIITPEPAGETVPWELLREPGANVPLVLEAQSFVRVAMSANAETLPTEEGPIRILLVICRPGGGDDVPFRSVASRLIRGLTQEARAKFRLDVLRPPTFDRLEQVLSEAHAAGAPYHVVHFDGHGTYRDLHGTGNPRGYLLFENPAFASNQEFIHGELLGQTLSQTGVAVFLLNACRSAHTETHAEPDKDLADNKAEAFGSLAHEVVKAGVPGVVAMRYNVYVVTAAQFVADLYGRLVQGHTLGEAVSLGRKQLAEQPLREIAYAPRPLHDWCVPVVYEAMPLALFPMAAENESVSTTLVYPPLSETSQARLPSETLPPQPVSRFLGRDETLLELDRAFDSGRVVLLHAYAGSGKTATAAEFGHWYSMTGGIEDGYMLFTSFEFYRPLTRLLDQLADAFQDQLAHHGITWLTLDDVQRRSAALQLLSEMPVLWIWDNVEPIAGFPEGIESAWSPAEQQELAAFLRDAQHTKAKFLLTSRRDEQTWLGDLPRRVFLPPMPMPERVQMLRVLAQQYPHVSIELPNWLPLLEYTQGNPLTITVVVKQALRDGLHIRAQLDLFLGRLRAGEIAFDDQVYERRTGSLDASLRYGFENTFRTEEQKLLALLALFQGFVQTTTLSWMGHSEIGDLPILREVTRDARIALLDRAAEVGLLTPCHPKGAYFIHPALPWFFKKLFEHHYPTSASADRETSSQRATHAFVTAVSALGVYYHELYYDKGSLEAIPPLKIEEANLLYTCTLSRTYAWWQELISAMQGLNVLYAHTGRQAEWQRLVQEIVPDYIDPTTDGALPGREAMWGLVTEYRVDLARKSRQWTEAERLQRLRVQWEREHAASAISTPPDQLDQLQRRAIRALAVSLSWLGDMLCDQENTACIPLYEEARQLHQRTGEKRLESAVAANLGMAYQSIPPLQDFAQAAYWYQQSLDLLETHDHIGRSRWLTRLGNLAYERFRQALADERPDEEMQQHLEDAVRSYEEALRLLPSDAIGELAVAHNQLGVFYDTLGEFACALSHYREAIRYFEHQGDLYNAARTRSNVAIALHSEARYRDALLYARAALSNYQSYGARTADESQQARDLIAKIVDDLPDDIGGTE